jgi:sugar phosphate isomerase/epimerase
MKGISRRTRSCAVVAATGVAVLAGSATAHAQRPASTGDGIPTGQMSTQMFNYGNFIARGINTGPASPITVSPDCTTPTPEPQRPHPYESPACQRERLEALFAFLQSKGVTSIELFGHAGFPAVTDTAGLTAYRELLDKYGLHAAGWHGNLSASVDDTWRQRVAAAKILGADSLGTGNFGSPGINPTGGQNNGYENTLRTAENLNEIGKYSVEQGVGPVYVHNHTGEFDAKYVDNGVLKTAWQIIVERTDPRYVFIELDVFWSSDAHDDVTGDASAALINQFPSRIKMLHVKDGINIRNRGSNPNDSRGGSPRATGTGELDFRPIFAAAKDRVQYYHHEHDGGTITDANISFTNLKGIDTALVPAVQGKPLDFAATAAGVQSAKALTIKNTGDAPLNVQSVQLASSTSTNPGQAQFRVQEGESPGDFSVVSTTCVGAVAPGATCSVQVGFKPTRTNHRSIARVIVQSNADNATEAILLTGSSNGDAQGGVGGDVPTVLSLQLGGMPSFGTFVPATARTYETAGTATVVSTAGNATLSVSDPSTNSAGHLVNGAFALAQPLQVRATNAANPNSAWAPLSETAGAAVNLLTYTGPTAGAEGVTLGFRQAIGANDVLRAGSYSKTLTFTLSTTTP